LTLFSEKEKEEQVASISNMLAALKDNTKYANLRRDPLEENQKSL